MAIFSAPPRAIGPTRMFARLRGAHQLTVFQITLTVDEPTVVALPIPIRDGGAGDVRLISMGSYPFFFADLSTAFGGSPASPEPSGDDAPRFAAAAGDVGLPLSFLQHWPGYESYGYVAFVAQGPAPASLLVAFSFPTRHPNNLYFPTLHFAGAPAPAVDFDCEMFAQPGPNRVLDPWWQPSSGPARGFMRRSRGIVDAYRLCFRGALQGSQPNGDRLVPLQ